MTRWSGARFYFLITSSNETCARLLFQLLYLEMETDSGLSREMVVTKRITFITQLKVMSHFPLPLPLPYAFMKIFTSLGPALVSLLIAQK